MKLPQSTKNIVRRKYINKGLKDPNLLASELSAYMYIPIVTIYEIFNEFDDYSEKIAKLKKIYK